jgi:hemerythrin superfamily protein
MSNPTPSQGQNQGQNNAAGSGRTEAEEQSAKSAHPGEKKDAIDLLKADHREVDQLFEEFRNAKGPQRKTLIDQIGAALIAHTIIEEEIFYPACRDKGVEQDDLNEAQVEHDTLKILVADLLNGSRNDEYYEAKAAVLGEYVKHHVGEEEDPSDGIFARAREAGLDMVELGQRLQTRKDELMADEKRLLSRPPQIRSLDLFRQAEAHGDMSRYPNDRYRDDNQPRRDLEVSGSGGRYRTEDGSDEGYTTPGQDDR